MSALSNEIKGKLGDETFEKSFVLELSEGKEFDHVILIGMVNDELPSFQSMKKGGASIEMEEERRNCFVAITRTQKKLYLTYSEKYFGWRKIPSLFLAEMFS